MADPLSASQVQKLGDRLRKSESPAPEDRALLQQVLLAHEAPMTEVARVLDEELGLPNTTRIKTEGTLLDKLRREKSNLARVDDIAGVRIQAVADRVEQDRVVAQIVERFPESEVKDRRENPSHGYRAVHVIVRHGGKRVEVQVRTRFQDAWAQIVERFADSVGRGIRYGDVPDDLVRLIGMFSQASGMINEVEILEAAWIVASTSNAIDPARIPEAAAHLGVAPVMEEVRSAIQQRVDAAKAVLSPALDELGAVADAVAQEYLHLDR